MEIEEERSSESSSRSGDVSDLFAESEDTTERLNAIDEIRDFSGVLTMAPSGVSISINSGGRANFINQEEREKRGEQLSQGDLEIGAADDGTGRSTLSNSAPVVSGVVAGGPSALRLFLRSDGGRPPTGQSDITAPTVTHAFSRRTEPSAEGRQEPISGQSGQSRELAGGVTQLLPAMGDRVPTAGRNTERGKEPTHSGPRSSGLPMPTSSKR